MSHLVSNMDDGFLIVFITAGNLDEARKIADELVGQRLAACVNIVPQVESVYRWQGEVCRDSEVLLVAKTTRERFSALETAVKGLHSYQVPEIIALPITGGSEQYLNWLRESVTPA
jgi:periplasmic divalent cation tolerance protein